MNFAVFETAARDAYEAIPARFRDGLDGIVVSRDAVAHPALPDVFTLGHCDTQAFSTGIGPDDVRSMVVLHYGSFRELAAREPGFDWEGEIRETVEHEVRHHLESLAREDDLEQLDYAADQSFHREEGRAWDPWFYRSGEPIGTGGFAVDDQVFLEQIWRDDDFGQAEEIQFRWRGRLYAVSRPDELGDLHFILVDAGVAEAPDWLELVLVRERGLTEVARSWLRDDAPVVHESAAEAVPIDP